MVIKALSFAFIGLINTVIDAVIFFAALHTATDSLIAANVMSWSVAVSLSYVMNSLTTFAAESGRTLRGRDFLRFLGSGVVAVIASTATLVLAAKLLPIWCAKLLAIGVSFAVNFSITHFLVFRPGGVRP